MNFYFDFRYDGKGTNFRLVATHQIGHALGLYHSNDKSSIMFDFYRTRQPEELLPKDVSTCHYFMCN